MATPFEEFVNAEVPARVSMAIPPGGNLPSGQMLVTTGIGLGVELGSGSLGNLDGGRSDTNYGGVGMSPLDGGASDSF